MGQFYANYINMGLDVAAPFLDYRNAHVGMRLPPWQTFFTRWHRATITRVCSALAVLPTSDGYTASNKLRHLPRNVAGYALVQLRRGAKKVSQKLLGKSMFHEVGAFAADAPGFMAHLRASSCFALAVERLKAAGILAPDLDPASVRDIHIGRILTMGLLLDYLSRD
jgi:hypothetical protein